MDEVIVLRLAVVFGFGRAGYRWPVDPYSDVLDEFLRHNDEAIGANVEKFSHLTSLQFQSVVGMAYDARVQVKRVYLYIFIVEQKEHKSI